MLMSLSDEIRRCVKCTDFGLVGSDRLNTLQKPYVQFDVEKNWKPAEVSVLFIAESPPWNGKQSYFYNPVTASMRIGLRREVLKYLGLGSLDEFEAKGCFLVDTIKCRLNKSKRLGSPLRLNRIAEECSSQFLYREIIALKRKTIFILGNTAKRAVERFPGFQELKNHRVTHDFDASLSGYFVILCPFPGRRTRKFVNEIDRAFRKI